MGVLNLKKEPYHRRRITTALRLRGMLPDTEEEWEIHGPHRPEIPYQVYVGFAISKDDPSDCPLVVVYPRGVYEIEDRSDWSDWGKAVPENKIPTIKSGGVTHDAR